MENGIDKQLELIKIEIERLKLEKEKRLRNVTTKTYQKPRPDKVKVKPKIKLKNPIKVKNDLHLVIGLGILCVIGVGAMISFYPVNNPNPPIKSDAEPSITADNTVKEEFDPYPFDSYGVTANTLPKKAEIDFSSNDIGRMHKTVISEGYNSGEVNFAGYYIVVTWGCGTGCICGSMVDVRDGKIYDLPLGEDATHSDCYFLDDYEKINHRANSRLLVSVSCEEILDENSTPIFNEKTHHWHIWNEASKEFITSTSTTREKIYTK